MADIVPPTTPDAQPPTLSDYGDLMGVSFTDAYVADTSREGLRERLAVVLPCPGWVACTPGNHQCHNERRKRAAALLPVVEQLIAKARADERQQAKAVVEALADEWDRRYAEREHMAGCPEGAGYYDLLADELRAVSNFGGDA